MRRCVTALAAVIAALALAAGAQADPTEYGIKEVSASVSTPQAGGHPDFTTFFKLKTEGEEGANLPSPTQDATIALPPGLLGNPTAVPPCSAEQLVTTDVEDPSNATGCPQASQVGITEVTVKKEGAVLTFNEPVFNMAPRFGEPARFGFIAVNYPVLVDTVLRDGPGGDYGVTATVEGISSRAPLFSAKTTIWGVPADERHDGERITAYEAIHGGTPETSTGKRESGLVPVPVMLNPTRCGVAQAVAYGATPYMLPTLHVEAFAPLLPNSGCGLLEFKPDFSVAPTTSQAETGTGLDANLSFPTQGLEHPNLLGEDEQRRVEVTLPEGLTVNPSEAVGLGVCSEADFEAETPSSGPNEGCPESSKIGLVTATSPLLAEPAEGGLYLAKPYQNPAHTLLAIYMVLKIPDRGVVVKLPGKVTPDPQSGQLVVTFGEAPYEIPQLPVAAFHLHFREGARAPLVTPPACGTYTGTATFTSWGGHTATTHPSFEITRGVNGGPCPVAPPFGPGFEAGSISNAAGSFSPFYMRLTRRDGDQDLTRFSAKLPPGVTAKLADVAECPDAALAAAKAKSGLQEQASPSCPASSEIGHVLAGAGVGEVLTYAEGKLYLAGPYQGAPLSVAAVVPAVAGPFDVGTVVTREALRIDPRTAEVEADGVASDPIPHILAGIPLKVRDVRVYVDRPSFTLNPTSCEPFSTAATIWAGGENVFSGLDDTPHSLSARFQAADCASLGFKPRLLLRLKGGTRRGAFPALHLTYRPRPGDANLAGLALRFPHSEFIEQGHFRTICTRVQFAAGQGFGSRCPAGSVYGHVTVHTPILAEPLSGKVFLRSSNHNLPDVVLALQGPPSLPVKVEVPTRIDSVRGGLRATATKLPDVPLSKVVLDMQGGQKGLFVNSTNLCARKHRARLVMGAHNGRRLVVRPALRTSCGKTKRKRHPHHQRQAHKRGRRR
jgi:hypothetical protein